MGTRIRLGEAAHTVGERALGGSGKFLLFRCVLGLLRGINLPKEIIVKYVGFKIIKCKLAMLFFSEGESE